MASGSAQPPATVLHTESSVGFGGQEMRIIAESRWLIAHGWRATIIGQPGARLLTEAARASVPAVAVRMRGAWDLVAVLALRRHLRAHEAALGPAVGLVANIRGSKGHAYFLEAARAVLAERPDARFLIVGDGIGFDDVQRRVKEMGLEPCVVMTGFRRDVPEIMAALDVLVLPSLKSEAMSQVIPQALAVGTPVVGTTVGGTPELVRDGETGRLVPPADAAALAAAILDFLRDPERARALARRGRALLLAQHSMDAALARTLSVYDAVGSAAKVH